MVVAVLFMGGNQVPEMLLFDTLGKGNKMLPAHTGGTWVKLGVTRLFTTMVSVLLLAKGESAQVALLVSSQVITSPLVMAPLVKVDTLVPTFTPLSFRCRLCSG